MSSSLRLTLLVSIVLLWSAGTPLISQTTLREKIGQMVMVTFTGDSLETRSASLDTLKADIDDRRIGGVIFFTWSNNLESPAQIRHLTDELQSRSATPLLIATDQEGGIVARLDENNGFAATQSAYTMGTTVNTEANTRLEAGTMAMWFEQTGINMNLAPVVDVNINPSSPAIGRYGRSFSASAATVTQHAGWFIDEFRTKKLITALKHFPGHGSAVGDSHDGFTDVTTTWTNTELQPFQDLVTGNMTDAVMTAHIYNAQFDTLHPATLSPPTIDGLLRTQLGFDGVVVSDAMEMGAITSGYGFDDAALRAVNAGVDILLYTRNIYDDGTSLARRLVDLIESKVLSGDIPASRIEESYDRIIALKQNYLTSVRPIAARHVPEHFELGSYPNPFNGTTHIRLQMPSSGTVSIAVFDMLGRQVDQIFQGTLGAGPATFRWSPSDHSSGTYMVRATSPSGSQTIRVLYLR